MRETVFGLNAARFAVTNASFRILSVTEDPLFGLLERIKIPVDTLTTGETLSQLHSPILVPAAVFVCKHGNALR